MLSVDRAETLLILSYKCLKFWICWVVCLAMQGLSFIVRSILCTQSILEQAKAEL